MPEGLIIRSTGSWYDVRNQDAHLVACRLKGKFKIQGLKITNPLAVGDRIFYELEDQQNTGIISQILPRKNYIIRKSVHKNHQGHMLAANIDQAVLIATLAMPRTSAGFIDRFLVTAEAFRIPSVLVFNKMDLLQEKSQEAIRNFCEIYEKLGYKTLLTSTVTGEGLEAFKNLLDKKVSLLSGHSGVGKSSLLNVIAPNLDLRTSEVSSFAEKGVHTTTFAEMFEIVPEMFVIDSPGIKELGLNEIEKDELAHYFPEMRKLMNQCKFNNCKHLNEPKCAVKEALETGEMSSSRYQSYLSMMHDEDNRR